MKNNQKGFSLIELLIVVVIIGVIAAIAIPNLLAARRAANESAAIANLHNITSAQHACVAAKLGTNKGDFCTDVQLSTNGLVDSTFNTMNGTYDRGGYLYTMILINSNKAFDILANPVSSGTGTRYFGTTESGAIFQNTTTAITFNATSRAPSAGSNPIQ